MNDRNRKEPDCAPCSTEHGACSGEYATSTFVGSLLLQRYVGGVPNHPEALDGVAENLLVEPRGVVNTGDTGDELTADNDVWV